MGRETTATDSSDPPEPPSTVVAPGERNASPTVHDSEPSDEKQREPSSSEPPDVVYPKGIKLAFLLLSVYVTTFLVALDRLIISTAIPQITDDFGSVTDVGWYGSAYMLTNCAFQLLFGKLYTFFSIKMTFILSVLIFAVGSAICGAAPNSVVFIVGRAVAGLASAGIMAGTIVILVNALPLHKRPLYQGIFGALFGLSSIIGPLLGGAFTTNVTWRWCFYINLPFAAVVMAIIVVILNVPDRDTTKLPLRAKVSQLDIIGTVMFIPGVISLLLALQWGGLTYTWNSWRVILLLTLSSVLLIGFVIVQIVMPDTATIPARIFVQRSIMAGFFTTLCIGAQMMIFIYFLPIWFQAIMGVSAVDSGIRLLAMVLPMVVSSVLTGGLTVRIGYYTPFLIIGAAIMAAGAGTLTTLQVDTPNARWIGFMVLYGWGFGNSLQAPNLAAQTVLAADDVPVGTALIIFSQLLGGAVFTSVGQNVFSNQLARRLEDVPGFGNATVIENGGATTITAGLPDDIRSTVLVEYNEALRSVFRIGFGAACVTILGALAIEWRSVKKDKPKNPTDSDRLPEEGAAAGGKDGI